MYSNTHTEEGKGHRRTRSGRSSKRSSRSDTVDDLARRGSRNEDERKTRKTRQKLELRAKQLNNANEEATPGSGDSTPVAQGVASKMGSRYHPGTGIVTSSTHPPYGASTTPSMGQKEQVEASSLKPGFDEWVGAQFPETGGGGDEIQEEIERLRVSNASPRPGDTTMSEISPQHRWGRVFAERGTPLPRIGAAPSFPQLSSPGTPPLQRRAAVRRKRMHASDTTITDSVKALGFSTNGLQPPNTAGEVIDNSFNISPITTRESICWDSPRTVTPATSILQETKTLPLHYRLPLTPTKTSPLGATMGPSTAGLPQTQAFPVQPSSLSLSVPNSPAFHAMNLIYQSGTTNPTHIDSSRYSHTNMAIHSNNYLDTYRSRSASPMVHDYDPRLRTSTQSTIPQRPMDIASSDATSSGRNAMRIISPGPAHSNFVPNPPNFAVGDGESRAQPSKPSQGGKVVKFRCVICMDKHRVSKMIQAPNCMHFLCITCVKELFKQAIRNPEDRCPVTCCNAEIPVETVSGILSIAQCAEYSRLAEDYNIPSNKTFCHIPTCREFIPPFSISRDSMAQCLKCHSLTCEVCKRGWHTGPCTHWEEA